MTSKHLFYFETKFGRIGIAENGSAITNVFLQPEKAPSEAKELATPLIRRAVRQIEEYLNGRRNDFDLPLEPEGTDFQKRVWQALREIPYGETRSYRDIAERIGNPKACRAVGMANNRNPIAIVIPCHRVIGADGSLVGYAGGLKRKRQLLDIEKQNVESIK